jgi:hypothetical protein
MTVKVLSEWFRRRVFELMKGQNNKKSRKPPKAYLHPIHHQDRVKGLSTKGCHARGALMEGSFIVLSIVTQVSLKLTC